MKRSRTRHRSAALSTASKFALALALVLIAGGLAGMSARAATGGEAALALAR